MNIGTWQVRGRRKFCCRWILNRTLWITAEPFLVKWQKLALFLCHLFVPPIWHFGDKREKEMLNSRVFDTCCKRQPRTAVHGPLWKMGTWMGTWGCTAEPQRHHPVLLCPTSSMFCSQQTSDQTQQPLFTPYSSGWVLWLLLGVLEDAPLKQDVSDPGNRAIRSQCSREIWGGSSWEMLCFLKLLFGEKKSKFWSNSIKLE